MEPGPQPPSAVPPRLKVHLWTCPLPACPSSRPGVAADVSPGCRELSAGRKSPGSLGGLCARHRGVLLFLCCSAPDSAVSGSESITPLSLYDELIRAARHVECAAPPPGLSVIFLWGGQQPGGRKIPARCSPRSHGPVLQEPSGTPVVTGPLGFSETPP